MTLPEMWDFLSLYLQYSFVQRAMIVTVLVALCSALLGVTLVLRRFSFIGDGLSHVAFGAMAVAAVLNLASELPLVLAVTVICAVLLLRTGQNAKIMGDAAMAMVSVGALAIGYLLMNIFSSSTNLAGDVCTTLFGSTSSEISLSMVDENHSSEAALWRLPLSFHTLYLPYPLAMPRTSPNWRITVSVLSKGLLNVMTLLKNWRFVRACRPVWHYCNQP